MEFDNGGEVVLAAAHVDVLIDGDVGEEAKAGLVAGGHHDGIVVGVGASHHVRTLHGRAPVPPLRVSLRNHAEAFLVAGAYS